MVQTGSGRNPEGTDCPLKPDIESYLKQYDSPHNARIDLFRKKITGFKPASPHTNEMRRLCASHGIRYDLAIAHVDVDKREKVIANLVALA